MSLLPMHDAASNEFYGIALDALQEAKIEFLLGGAFALRTYTGIERNTKDLDLMVRPQDVERILDVHRSAGFRADIAFSHWLAKVHCGEYFIDVIYRAGNGLGEVDDAWFEHARTTTLLERELRVAPPEEMIWQKGYIMERERFDGADILHLLRCCSHALDWDRLLERFGKDWRVLLGHLIHFGFVYPGQRDRIPQEVLHPLLKRAMNEPADPSEPEVCHGTLLSRAQYLVDVERWGLVDARLTSHDTMTSEQVQEWTTAIGKDSR